MFCLTAIIRAKKGTETTVLAELLKVGGYAKEHEPGTIDFFVTQDANDPCLFSTYERFVDQAAMEKHNEGAGSQGFFTAAGDLLDGPVTVVMANEIWPKK